MLKHKVELYVPANTPEQQGVVNSVFHMFCEEFRGATVNPVLSGWIDGKGNLITGKISIVYSYTANLTREKRLLLKKIAVNVRGTLNEDAVTLVIDNVAEFY